MKQPILVWSFQDAPEHLRKLSTNGGDEDWLAVVPPHAVDSDGSVGIPWMQDGTPFGCCCVDEFEHPMSPDYIVRIGSHA